MKSWVNAWLWGGVLIISLGARAASVDYEQPKLLTGSIAARGSSNLLYRFKRTALRDGATVRVLREFTEPDGKLAARERCTFVDGQLSSFQLDQLQTGAQGTTTITADPANPRKRKLRFEFVTGTGDRVKRKESTETTEGTVLVGDMIPYFIVEHWDDLMNGRAAAFRFIAQERLETVGFKLVQDGATSWRGRPAVRLRMEPTSMIISALVDPLFFLVDPQPPHRVLQYDGRTTPKRRDGNSWKDLDALNTYDWN